jgi:hypothetical protein
MACAKQSSYEETIVEMNYVICRLLSGSGRLKAIVRPLLLQANIE